LFLVAAVELVTGLHYDEIATDPTVLLVDSTCETKRASRGFEVPMHVSESHDALLVFPDTGDRYSQHRQSDEPLLEYLHALILLRRQPANKRGVPTIRSAFAASAC
jgi:hypothetical protein